ncbi:MAG TPA: YtxH domain-containing protein [Chitinophagaceae bacterium]|nr:YtxH domain-containing protein [Chitinophagaceae bacterium]
MAKALMLVLAGIAIGILIAPDKGSETLKKVTNRLDDYTDEAKDAISDASGKIKSKLHSAKGDMKDAANETF